MSSWIVFAVPYVLSRHNWFTVSILTPAASVVLLSIVSQSLATISLIVSPVQTSTQLRLGPCQTKLHL